MTKQLNKSLCIPEIWVASYCLKTVGKSWDREYVQLYTLTLCGSTKWNQQALILPRMVFIFL